MFYTRFISLTSRYAVYFLLLGAACIAFAPIFVRLSEVGPSATAFYRLLFSLPLLWAWISWDKKGHSIHRQPASWQDYWKLSLAGFFFTADIGLWHWSIMLTSVANSTLLVNFAPIFVTIGGYLFFKEKVTRVFLVGMMCAIAGMIILLGDSLIISPEHLRGDMIAIVAAVFYGAYLLTVSRLRSQFSTVTVMAWSGMVSCVLFVPVTLISGESFMAGSVSGWLILAGLALISHVGGQSMITYALAHLPAAFGSVGLLLQPVIAAILAWLIFNEALSMLQLAGGIIVLIGIYLARRGTLR